ncbi:MAG TPA: type II toxin-antitoxin system PemK/MazF family toxin [Thermoanaerobaculia bacterium]|nr:type II toxin-antitoxin system PemK/MazF family toxin [Thermoanaerobaculia bacterium]
MTTSGDNNLPSRGEVWWVRIDKLRPAVVVQTDNVRDERVRSFLVVPLTSRVHLEGMPGNVRLDRHDTGLPKTSVANVYDVQKVFRSDFVERLRKVSADRLKVINEGVRLVLDL